MLDHLAALVSVEKPSFRGWVPVAHKLLSQISAYQAGGRY